MGKQRALLAVVLCACGPGAKDASGPAGGGKLCVDPAAPGGAVIALDYEDPPGHVVPEDEQSMGDAIEPGWNPMGVATAGTVTYALIVHEGCYMGDCDPHVVRIDGGAVTHRVPVPAADTIPQQGDYPFAIEWMLMSGDAVWLSYNIVGAPEPAIGSTTRSHVAVFGPDDLALRFSTPTTTYPEASSLDTCTSELAAVDADCDGDMDLVQTETCLPSDCQVEDEEAWRPDDCPEAPMKSHTVYEQGANQMFTERKGA